jgi:hypothetical protein
MNSVELAAEWNRKYPEGTPVMTRWHGPGIAGRAVVAICWHGPGISETDGGVFIRVNGHMEHLGNVTPNMY